MFYRPYCSTLRILFWIVTLRHIYCSLVLTTLNNVGRKTSGEASPGIWSCYMPLSNTLFIPFIPKAQLYRPYSAVTGGYSCLQVLYNSCLVVWGKARVFCSASQVPVKQGWVKSIWEYQCYINVVTEIQEFHALFSSPRAGSCWQGIHK